MIQVAVLGNVRPERFRLYRKSQSNGIFFWSHGEFYFAWNVFSLAKKVFFCINRVGGRYGPEKNPYTLVASSGASFTFCVSPPLLLWPLSLAHRGWMASSLSGDWVLGMPMVKKIERTYCLPFQECIKIEKVPPTKMFTCVTSSFFPWWALLFFFFGFLLPYGYYSLSGM